MGGRGSGGRRIGSGQKKKSTLERAISGTASTRGVVLQHPSSTAVAPVETFDPPAELQGNPEELAKLTEDLAFLEAATGPGELNPQIGELQTRIDKLQATVQALAIWHELAPHAFAARTLTPATSAAFVMLCRGIVEERRLSASAAASGPDHRGMMQRISTWMKDFCVSPFGKPMYEAAAPVKSALDRFTQTRA
jgi:hypothetical protein